MYNKLNLITLFVLFPIFYFSQTTVFGYLKNDAGKVVENAVIEIKGGESVKVDKIGYFQFVDVKPGQYIITIYQPNYETKVLEFEVSETNKKKDLGIITLYNAVSNTEQGLAFLDNTDNEEASQNSTVGLLQSSLDVFNRIAAFDLGAYWFRPRGVDGRASETIMNGASMAKGDNGFVDFNNWGGLNEITRYPEIAPNHNPSEYSFGGINGVLYKNTKASEYRKGFQFVQSLTNRNYRNRTSLRYSSGMSKKGWAFTVMGARRWAQEGIQEGTFNDSYGTYFGIEKKINDKHTITLNSFASPYRRSTASPSTQEVYDYRGVHYNAYWGWQDGKKRSERVRQGFQPIIQLQDFLKINDKTNLWTTISYQFGKDKSARLDWQNVSNPSPTYYRNLPSYYQSQLQRALENDPTANVSELNNAYQAALENWQNNNQDYTQINWQELYSRNLNQPIKNYYGQLGRRALYFQVNDVSDDKIWNIATHLSHQINDYTKFILNLSYQNYRSEQYREVKDLLGADFALNLDPFAATNQPGTTGLFNQGEANVTKGVGDKITYDYIFRRQDFRVNPALKLNTGNWDLFVSGMAGYNSSSREGFFNHYLYADSKTRSPNKEFWNFGLKGQAIYRINGRNFIVYNGAVLSQAPFLEDLFINPRVNAATAPNIKNSVNFANDLSYVLNTPFVKLRLSGYLVDTENETSVQRFFADGIQLETTDEQGNTTPVQSAFVTQVMSNVEKRNMGAELGISYKVTSTLELQGVASYGQFTYKNDPTAYFATDAVGVFENGQPFIELGKAYLNKYRQGGTPQKGYSMGFRYNSPKYWWFGANWNYLDDNFLDPSALLRTERFLQNPVSGTPYAGLTESELRRVLQPNKLPATYFLNANAGKSWLLGKYYVLISASVNNILNNTKYVTGGFEQTRNVLFRDFQQDLDYKTPLFGPRLFYNQGRSYFINLQIRF